VDERRAALGMIPLAEYIVEVKMRYGLMQ